MPQQQGPEEKTIFDFSASDSLHASYDSLDLLQERRDVLARLLKGKLQPFVSGEIDMPGFQAKFTKEAEELASLPFGVPMLHLIG